jgi:hypothetical protein
MARKEKQYHFIYKTTNLVNCKYYYGMHSTNNLNDGYYGSGKRLRYSLNKYGKESHKVEHIEFLPNRKSLIEREKEIVNLNEIAKEDCMNLIIGGGACQNGVGGNIHANRLKIDSEYADKHVKNFKKMVQSIRSTRKLGYDWTDKKHTDEEKRKIGIKNSIKQKGENNSQYGTCWITNEIENKKIYNGTDIPNGWRLGRKLKMS